MRQTRRKRGFIELFVCVGLCLALTALSSKLLRDRVAQEYVNAHEVRRYLQLDRRGLESLTSEAVLALVESSIKTETNDLPEAIQTRLNAAGAFGLEGASYALANAPALAAQTLMGYYGTQSVETDFRDCAVPLHTKSFLEAGPFSRIADVDCLFRQSGIDDPWEVSVIASLFSVPLTNWEVVAYGLPASEGTPPHAPDVGNTLDDAFYDNGGRALVLTSNNPANDSTAFADLYDSTASSESLPYYYRAKASLAWNAYETLWSLQWWDNRMYASSVWDCTSFDEQSVTGLSEDEATKDLVVDVASLASGRSVMVICGGGERVIVKGSSASGAAVALWIRNANQSNPVTVVFSGQNLRPIVFFGLNVSCTFDGTAWYGAFFFSPYSAAYGAATIFGHVSFYGCNSSFLSDCGLAVRPSAYKSEMSVLAPRTVVVGTKSELVQ